MTTLTSPRVRKQPERHLRLSDPINGRYALLLSVGGKDCGYYLEPLAADYGIGFRLEKFGTCRTEDEPNEYHVNIDRHGHNHSCECKGFLRFGMTAGKNRPAAQQRGCKHIAALLSLIETGKLAAAVATVKGERSAPIPQPQPKPQPVAKPKYCRFCGCLESEHLAGFCPA